MKGSPIATDLSPIGDIPEGFVQKIAKVEPERRQEVFSRATELAKGVVHPIESLQ